MLLMSSSELIERTESLHLIISDVNSSEVCTKGASKSHYLASSTSLTIRKAFKLPTLRSQDHQHNYRTLTMSSSKNRSCAKPSPAGASSLATSKHD
jgi:hypothetical protein